MPQHNFGRLILFNNGLPGLASPVAADESALLADVNTALHIAKHQSCELWSGVTGQLLHSGLSSDTFICGECTSSLDVAWKLMENNLLSEWGAVVPLSQSCGRGQLRRTWYSPAGNLHVSFCLPASPLFTGSAASVLVALLFIKAFERIGLELYLKWPNDLVLFQQEIPGKFGGLLLEEREGVLLVGVGLNCQSVPERQMLRADAALPPVTLPEGFHPRFPVALWLKLVPELILVYKKLFCTSSVSELLRIANDCLLWQDQQVIVTGGGEGGADVYGRLEGLAENGGLVLSLVEKNVVICSGSLARTF